MDALFVCSFVSWRRIDDQSGSGCGDLCNEMVCCCIDSGMCNNSIYIE